MWFNELRQKWLGRGQRRRKRRQPAPWPRDRRLYLEPLEDRRLLSASYTVTNTSADASVAGSLPWAVAQADTNNSGGSITINFASDSGDVFATQRTITLAATLNLDNPQSSIIIAGPTTALTIDGGGSGSDFSVVTVASGTTAAAGGLEISDGNSQWGGGIYNSGDLTLSACTIADNQAISATGQDAGGGGIYNGPGAILNLNDGTNIVNNTAQGGAGTAGSNGLGGSVPGQAGANGTTGGNGGQGLGGGIYNDGGIVNAVLNSSGYAAEIGGDADGGVGGNGGGGGEGFDDLGNFALATGAGGNRRPVATVVKDWAAAFTTLAAT